MGSEMCIRDRSSASHAMVSREVEEWAGYGDAMREFLLHAFVTGGGEPGLGASASGEELELDRVVPRLADGIRGQEFSLGQFEGMVSFSREHPQAVSELGLSRAQTTQILNFVNGERSVLSILNRVAALTGEPLRGNQVRAYLEILQEVGWVVLEES